MSLEQEVREDSLIKEYKVTKSDRNMYAHKVVFITVRDIELSYYTNSNSFVESLKNFKGDTFVITYAKAELSENNQDVKNRIVRVKLPKSYKMI